MKKVLIAALPLLLTACAATESINATCGGDLRDTCSYVFGRKDAEQDEALNASKRRAEQLEQRVSALELKAQQAIDSMDATSTLLELLQVTTSSLQQQLNYLSTQASNGDAALQAQISSLQTQVTSNTNSINLHTTKLNSLQTTVNNHTAQIAALQTNENITEFVDPCGNGPGYDEVLLRTSSGKLVAYFESGGSRFLTTLKPSSSYQVTDGTGCKFDTNSSGQIVNERY